MPVPLLAPLITGGASLLGGLFNSLGQARQNKLSRDFALRMYQMQRDDSLQFWGMQNEYNSPEAQMQRFRDAGLNPHLVYSQGNPGNAAQIETPNVQRPDFVNPQFGDAIVNGAMSTISALYDLEMKQAQTDNLKAQNSVIMQDAMLKGVQIAAGQVGTERARFDLDFAKDMRSINADAQRLAVRKTEQDIMLASRRDLRDAVMSSANVNEIAARIESMFVRNQSEKLQQVNTRAERDRIIADTQRIRKSIRLMSQEGIIKQLDVELAKNNIRAGDPVWYRSMLQGVDAIWNWLFDKPMDINNFGSQK